MTPHSVSPQIAKRFETGLLEMVRHAVIATDVEGRVVTWNTDAEQLYGWRAGEAIGRPILELTPSSTARADAIAIMKRMMCGESCSGEFEVRRKDGSEFTAFVVNAPVFDTKGTLTGVVGVSVDVSERAALERQVHQIVALHAIQQLAAHVADECDGLLATTLGQAETTIIDLDTDAAVSRARQAAGTAAAHAAELTQQLLAFGREPVASTDPGEVSAPDGEGGQRADPEGRSTILLADDDGSRRTSVSRILSTAGYRVLSAARWYRALRLGLQHDSRIDLLLTAHDLPDGSPFELAIRLRQVHPTMQLLVMTDHGPTEAELPAENDHFIDLPVVAAPLLSTVQQFLEPGDSYRATPSTGDRRTSR